MRGEGGADDLAKRGFVALRAADRHLIPLRSVLVDAENADVTDVVVPARVHAARNVEVELADVVQIIEIVETALDRLRNRNRLGVRQRAEIAAGTTNDIRQQAEVGCGDSKRFELGPQRKQIRLADVRENQVLLMGNAKL